MMTRINGDVHFKPLQDQVIVITGGSSGIGLVTARMAARCGAKVVVAARNETALREIVNDINARGGQAAFAVGDVGIEADVRRIAQIAIDRFGGFDTWVNNAAVSIYGRILDVSLEDQRRLFDTNYWGVVHGCRVAVEHLQHRGGAIVTVCSVLGDRAIPLQGPYCASKHAVKGFIEALRMEVEADELPISISLIKPASIDTPYKEHAKNLLPTRPRNPPPVYAPELVARAILHCAQRVRRDVVVGGAGRSLLLLGRTLPRTSDRILRRLMPRLQMTDQPAETTWRDNLYEPGIDGQERGGDVPHIKQRSLYTTATLHPVATTLAALGLGAIAIALSRNLVGRLRLRPPQRQLAVPSGAMIATTSPLHCKRDANVIRVEQAVRHPSGAVQPW